MWRPAPVIIVRRTNSGLFYVWKLLSVFRNFKRTQTQDSLRQIHPGFVQGASSSLYTATESTYCTTEMYHCTTVVMVLQFYTAHWWDVLSSIILMYFHQQYYNCGNGTTVLQYSDNESTSHQYAVVLQFLIQLLYLFSVRTLAINSVSDFFFFQQ